jgi:hypothetical protein
MNVLTNLTPAILDRAAVRRDTRRDEEQLVAERLDQARLDPAELSEAQAIARALVSHVRAQKPAGLDAAARGLVGGPGQMLNIPQPDLPAGAVAEPLSRNAPCPCGSGKKFKHCHGQLA